jgi:hypothetical protein
LSSISSLDEAQYCINPDELSPLTNPDAIHRSDDSDHLDRLPSSRLSQIFESLKSADDPEEEESTSAPSPANVESDVTVPNSDTICFRGNATLSPQMKSLDPAAILNKLQ